MGLTYVSDLMEFGQAPGYATPANRVNGVVRLAVSTFDLSNAAYSTVNDVILLAAVPSNATILTCFYGGANQGASALIDIGFCDALGANVSPSGTDSRERLVNAFDASVGNTYQDRRFTTFTTATIAQPLWQLMGHSADPGRPWYMCVRIQAVGAGPTGAGTQVGLQYISE